MPPAASTPAGTPGTAQQPTATAASRQRKTKRTASGRKRPRSPAIPPERKPLVDQMCAVTGPTRERFNQALRARSLTGERSLLILLLARQEFKTDALLNSEVAEVLNRAFRMPAAYNSVNMALNKMITAGDPLVAARESELTGRVEFWLTQRGIEQVASWVSS